MKDMLKLLTKCLCITLAVTMIILGLNIPYQKIDDEKYMDLWNLQTLGNQIPYIQVANVGSSHGAYDFVYDGLLNRAIYGYNFGNVSQTYNYDLAMLKEYGDYIIPGGILFIPVSYFSFNNEVINDTEAQALSIKYYHCLSSQNVPDYDLFTDIVTHKLPILSAGEDLLQLVPSLAIKAHAAESVEQNSEDAGQANEDVSSEGVTSEDVISGDIIPEEIYIDYEEFAARAEDRFNRHFANKDTYFLPEREAQLLSIIDYCKERNITPVLITTPFSSYYQEQVPSEFLDEFHAKINTIAETNGINYYDYSCDERFYDNLQYFSDSDHLNNEGATYFMQILVQETEELQAMLK